MAKEESPDDVLYVKNELGGVHSVSREFAERNLYETTNAGNSFLLPGWEIITEAAAKKARPQLFGALDPQVVYTEKERAELKDQLEFQKSMNDIPSDDPNTPGE